MTWRRLAPTARSRASSRSRWATMIENVLKMTNDPTNSAMNAKTSRKVPKKLSAWWTRLLSLGGDRLAADHLEPGVMDGRLDPAHQLVLRDAGRGLDVDLVDLAGLAEHPLGGRRVERGDGRAERAVRAAPGGDAGDRCRCRAAG